MYVKVRDISIKAASHRDAKFRLLNQLLLNII